MLNYELVRAIQLEREREAERTVRVRSLRAAVAGKDVIPDRDLAQPTAPSRGSVVVPVRFR
jgi:hypothetical protein